MSDDHKPQSPSPQGGRKDTDDLSGIKGVQKPGMAQKKQDAEQRPQPVQTPATGNRSGQG